MVPRGSGRPRSSQEDCTGMDEAGKGDEGLARGPLCLVRPGEVLLWDWGSSACAHDLVGEDCREEPGVASRGSCPGPGDCFHGVTGRPDSHLVGEPVREGCEAGCSERHKKELPAWFSMVNPRVKVEYFQFWQDLNMLYEWLSLPWELLQCPEVQRPIRTVIDNLYYDIMSLWTIWKGNIQIYEGLSQEERTRAYTEGELEPCYNPWINLDYNLWDTWVEETADEFFQQPREKRPRELYRQHCT